MVVQNHCSECHHEDLSGGEGPALAGPTFMLKWETHTVERLFHKIRDTMPSVGDTDVTHQEKLDSVAFILQQNGFPGGQQGIDRDARRARVAADSAEGRPGTAARGRARTGHRLSSGNFDQQVGADEQLGAESDDARSDERRRQTIGCRGGARERRRLN